MNFPAGPSNGQVTTINGIVYIYDATKTAWKRSTSFGGNLTILGNITSANVITGNVYTSGGIYWSNNGAAYSSGGGGGGSSNFLYTAAASAPGGPTKGDQWFDTTDGTLYEYMDDGDSFQWVDIQTPTFASNAITTLLSGDVSTDGNISASSIVITSGIYWANGVAFVSSVYSNVNVEAYIGANIGSYQTYANANAAAQAVSINTINANLGAYQSYANANIGTLFLGNASTNANLGAYQTYANSIIYSNTNAAAYLTTTLVPFANSVSLTAMTNSQLYYVTFGNVAAGNTILHSGGSLTWNPSTQALVAAGSVQTSSITAAAGGVNVFNTTATTINMGGAASNVLIGTTSGTATNTIFGGTGVTGGQATGNIFAGNIHASSFRFANGVNILSTITAGSTYSNTNVAAYLTLGANIGSGTTTTNLVAAATTTTTSTTTGALVVKGGTGIAGVTMVGGNLVAASGTTSSSVTTGALVVVGGTGISGTAYIQNLYVNQDMYVEGGFLQARSGYTATSTTSGAIIIPNSGGLGVTGNAYVGNEFVVPGGGKLTSTGLAYLLEKVTVSASAPSGNVDIDMSTQSVLYWTGNATANVTANIRGTATQPLNSLLATGQSVTAVLFLPNGPSNFLVSNVRIDNALVTAAYQGNAAPVLGNSNSIDIYSFTILKTADATYKVFASQTQFMHPG